MCKSTRTSRSKNEREKSFCTIRRFVSGLLIMCRRRLFVIYWVLKLSFGDVLSCVIRDVCLKDWGLPEGMGLSDEFRPEVLQRPRCGKYVHGSSWGWESKRQYVLGFNAMLLWIPGAVGSCSTSDSQGFVKEHEGFARYH